MISNLPHYPRLSAVEIAAAVRAGDLSAHDTLRAAQAEIDRHDERLRAFAKLWPEAAARHADDVDRQIRAGEHLPLAGVPIGVKATEGLGAFQTTRLLAAGCVPVGATTTPGPGPIWQTWGSSDRGPTRNPDNPEWSPGGSSAGSAVAVAAGMVPIATGSDGAGSIRIPAAWCSIIGLKPTNGTAPARDRAGLNIAGPLARTATDAALYLSTLTDAPYRAPEPLATPMRTGWSRTLGFAQTDDHVASTAFDRLIALAAHDQIDVHDTDLRLTDPATCWAALRAGADPACAAALRHDLDRYFARHDLLATPTTPNPPHGHEGPGATYSVALTWAFNITGHPAISIPAGHTPAGEPVGLQLVARHGHEHDLLAIAAQLAG
ncbi:amidase [Kribbella sandramycini]|uniref:Amidase n=1 Tax=Kribbella sandramycini TaxID=60450 RepID=A0A7Y4L305_9ACTN|nr:amidase [Kribbella sandramycini]MBB6571221.1 Asp-tRNA(Asn)/Glu-tRNA(Gln) amidotransferase A subunit family amidase [Kribbella sandramycini]NOL43372.1 amidase [Kribbella sandramycini]